MPDPRVQRLAQALVDYSIDVQTGQRVLVRGGHPHPLVALPRLVEGELFYQNGAFKV